MNAGTPPPPAKRNLGVVTDHLATFAPAIGLAVITSLAPYFINLAADCAPDQGIQATIIVQPRQSMSADEAAEYVSEKNSIKGNPLLCTTGAWWNIVKESFNTGIREIRRGIDDGPPDGKDEDENQIDRKRQEIAALQKRVDDLVTARASQDKTLTPGIGFAATAADSDTALKAMIDKRQASLFSTVSYGAREASARLRWTTSFGLLLLATAAALAISAWMIGRRVLEEQRFGERGGLLKMAAAIAAGALGVWVLFAVMQAILGDLIFIGRIQPPPNQGYFYLVFQDNIWKFIRQHLIPGIDGVIAIEAAGLYWTVIGLAIAITASLWPVEQKNMTNIDREQRHYGALVRLQALYIVSSILVVATIHQTTCLYKWPLSLMETKADGTPSLLSNQINDAIDQMLLGTGLAATAILACLAIPSYIILYQRVFSLALELKGNDPNGVGAAKTWMVDHGFTFTSPQKIGQVIAVLAPTLSALATQLLPN